MGYVRLLNFYDHSAQRLEEAVTQLQEQGRRRWSLTCGTTAAAT